MQKTRAFRHSGLYYRNTLIVWASTILVFWFGLSAPRNWIWVLACLAGGYLVLILWVTYRSVHPGRSIFRRRIPKLGVDLDAEQVSFFSRDGLTLSGWFVGGRTRRVIILLHGLGGTGLEMSHQGRMLNRAGYSVLMPDLRAHGRSEGDTVTGVMEVNDVLGALDYLATRPDVDISQVGILGVSLGGLVALRAARHNKAIRVLVLESIGPAVLADHGGHPTSLRGWLCYPFTWLMYQLFEFFCGVDSDEGVIESLHWIYPRPVLFVSAGRGAERKFTRVFYEAARYPKSLLEVPSASHGIASVVGAREYRARVLRTFAGIRSPKSEGERDRLTAHTSRCQNKLGLK